MNKHRGSMGLLLLLFLASLLPVAGAFLRFTGQSEMTLTVYQEGLISVYAAESGANWALEALKAAPLDRRVTFDVNRRHVTVEAEEHDRSGRLTASAVSKSGNYKRYISISYSVTEEDGARRLQVEDIQSDKS